MSYLNSQNSLELLLCHFGIAQVTAKKLNKQQKTQLTNKVYWRIDNNRGL